MEKRIGIRTGKEILYFEDEEYVCFEADRRNAWAYVEYKEGDKRHKNLILTKDNHSKKEGWLKLYDTRHLKCFEKLGLPKGILRSHRKWLVNLKRVFSRTTTTVKVHNCPKEFLPIGPKFRKAFKEGLEPKS